MRPVGLFNFDDVITGHYPAVRLSSLANENWFGRPASRYKIIQLLAVGILAKLFVRPLGRRDLSPLQRIAWIVAGNVRPLTANAGNRNRE
jgi:hypothetical protein